MSRRSVLGGLGATAGALVAMGCDAPAIVRGCRLTVPGDRYAWLYLLATAERRVANFRGR